MRTLPVVALALVAATYSSAVYAASGWADLATVSTTMGIQSGHLCIGDAPAGDVGCPKELKADNDNLRADFEAYKKAHP